MVRRSTKNAFYVGLTLVACLAISRGHSLALETSGNDFADDLALALFPGGDGFDYTLGDAFLDGHVLFDGEFGTAFSSGTFTNASGTYGIGNGSGISPEGVVLSTGNILDYGDGPNFESGFTTEFEFGDEGGGDGEFPEVLLALGPSLDPITGQSEHFDVTQLDIPFFNSTGSEQPLDLWVVFGSEEFPDFVGSSFNDGFGVFLNDTNLAVVDGAPLNISHPDFIPVQGTELNAVLAPDSGSGFDPRLLVSGVALPGFNMLTLLIGDASDSALDTTAYVSREAIPGDVPGVPLFPDAIDPETGRFDFEGIGADEGETIFIDPDVAVGYDYEVIGSASDPDPQFASVTVNPTPSDSSFLISYGSVVDQVIDAGIVLNLTILEPGGVNAFSITGISVDDMLPPDNPLAFVTGVSFTTAVSAVTITQTPIVVSIVPEPSTLGLLAIAAIALPLRRRRR